MAGIGPVAGFKQHGAQQTDFDHLTAHAVDLDPVAHADSITAHQNEPAKEGDNEIFHGNGQAGAG